MTPLAVTTQDCWNRIGVWGDQSCPELSGVVHCHNCPVFTDAGRRFLDSPSPDGYLDEWAERLAVAPPEIDTNLESVLIFRVHDEWLALSVHVLVEVTPCRTVHRVPHRAGLLAGIVNIRGELALCVHLPRLLGIQSNSERSETTPAPALPGQSSERFLVVRKDAERWVLPVDEVDLVHRVAQAELAEAPATLRRASSHLTRGVFVWNSRSVGLLDADRLFGALRTKLR